MPKKQRKDEGVRRAPKGHFVVYVGEEMRRFVIPLSYLKDPTFQKLLEKAAEEYRFSTGRGIVLPCDESTFRRFLNLMDSWFYLTVNAFLKEKWYRQYKLWTMRFYRRFVRDDICFCNNFTMKISNKYYFVPLLCNCQFFVELIKFYLNILKFISKYIR